MFNDANRRVTGAELYPFRGEFPTKEEFLDDHHKDLLREFYLALYGEHVENFQDQNRSRGRSDRSAFILFNDGDHVRPAKVLTTHGSLLLAILHVLCKYRTLTLTHRCKRKTFKNGFAQAFIS